MKIILFLAVFSLCATVAMAESFTISYRCQGKKAVSVCYVFGEATATATVTLDGKKRTLRYDGASNAGTTVFASGPYTLSVENKKDMRQARSMMLTKQTTQIVNGRETPVSAILFKGCDPR